MSTNALVMSFILQALAESPDTSIEWIPREAWGAKPQQGDCNPHVLSKLSVHHTATFSKNNAKSPRRLRSYQRHHQKQGWPDLAYHFFIDLNGNVYEGRNMACTGDTFTNYNPKGHFLVVLEGNFQKQSPSPAALSSLSTLLAWAAKHHEIDPETLKGHRDLASTACPGKHLYQAIQSGALKKQIEAKMLLGATAVAAEEVEAKARVKEIAKGR